MPFWDEFKSPEQIEAERREKENLVKYIVAVTDRVPAKVIAGSFNAAAQWKEAAIKGRRLAQSKAPGLQRLRDAAAALRSFE